MNCRQARRQMPDLLDRAGNEALLTALRRHLDSCPTCRREWEDTWEALERITPGFRVRASADFKERVMAGLAEQVPAPVDTAGRTWRLLPRLAVIGAFAIALLIVLPYLGTEWGRRGDRSSPVIGLLAQSVPAMSNLSSVHLSARMRTLPSDNFELIGLEYEFVPIEMWKQFSDPPRWRVEKPGRIAVMDGEASLLFIKPNQAFRGGPRAGIVEWLKPLLDPDQILERELHAARAGQSQARLSEESRSDGNRIVLAVAKPARGDYANDWMRNKTFFDADLSCVYRFDAVSKRLEGLQVFVRSSGRDILVFEVTEIRYNEPMDPALFALQLPENVVVGVDPRQMPAGTYALPSTPRQAAVAFFEGMSREDWNQVLTVHPMSVVSESLKGAYGGLQIISIGEPFRSGLYRGWFVPYEIKLKSGRVKKHNLAVRNDNRARRWHVDGGY